MISGRKNLPEYRYSGRLDAARVMDSFGASVVWELFDRHMTRTTHPEAGDLCAFTDADGHGLCGIWCGNEALAVVVDRGLCRVQRHADIFWSVA